MPKYANRQRPTKGLQSTHSAQTTPTPVQHIAQIVAIYRIMLLMAVQFSKNQPERRINDIKRPHQYPIGGVQMIW